jgi:hypothetical protein
MVHIEENCALCSVTFPYYSLNRCIRCGKLYCSNCFLYDEEGRITCLRCAKRRIVPRAPSSKYAPLSMFLARRAKYANYVTLSFSRIEDIIGDELPSSALNQRQWWNNNIGRSHSESWLTVGWAVEDVSLGKKEVVFKKEKPTDIRKTGKRQRRKPVSSAFKALALKRKPKKPAAPSKTRLAMVRARAENVSRRSSASSSLRGKLKPKRAYEKRLYKGDEKPDSDSK